MNISDMSGVTDKGQSREWRALLSAVSKNKLALGRDLVTHIFPATRLVEDSRGTLEARLQGYCLLFDLAVLILGDLDAALEIAPFTGSSMYYRDYEACRKSAIRNGRKADAKACHLVLQRWGKQ